MNCRPLDSCSSDWKIALFFGESHGMIVIFGFTQVFLVSLILFTPIWGLKKRCSEKNTAILKNTTKEASCRFFINRV